MALGFQKSNGGGDFLPVFKFNAVSGDSSIASSVKNEETGQWDKKEVEIKFPIKFIFDLENIEVGWMLVTKQAVSFKMVKFGNPFPEQPDKEHKQGFRVKVYNQKHGVAAFSHSSKVVQNAIDELHTQYEKAFKENAGKVPVIEIKGTKKIITPTKDGDRPYKQPEWSIVSWVPRPEALTEKKVEPVQEASAIDDVDEF